MCILFILDSMLGLRDLSWSFETSESHYQLQYKNSLTIHSLNLAQILHQSLKKCELIFSDIMILVKCLWLVMHQLCLFCRRHN